MILHDTTPAHNELLQELDSTFIANVYKRGYNFLQSIDGVYLLGQKIPNIDEVVQLEEKGKLIILTGKNGSSVGFFPDSLEKDGFITNFDFSNAIITENIGDFRARKEDSIAIGADLELFWNGKIISEFELGQSYALKGTGEQLGESTYYLTDGITVLFGGERVLFNPKDSYTSPNKNTLITDTQVIVQGKILEGVSPKGVEEMQGGHYINEDGVIFYTGTHGGSGCIVPGILPKKSLSFGALNASGERFLLIGDTTQSDDPSQTISSSGDDGSKRKEYFDGKQMIYRGKIVDIPSRWHWQLQEESKQGYPEYITYDQGPDNQNYDLHRLQDKVTPKIKGLISYSLAGIPAKSNIHTTKFHASDYAWDSQNNIYKSGSKIFDFSKVVQIKNTNSRLFNDTLNNLPSEVQEFLDKKFRFYDIGYNLGKRFAGIMR